MGRLEEEHVDNTQIKGRQDRSRINIHEEHELRYWTEALGVTEARLIALVKKVGVSADAVRKELAA
jgi:hypothetical protein